MADTVKYSATTGKALKTGEKTTDAKGYTYTAGESFSKSAGGKSVGATATPNNLSDADIQAGYSTIPGKFDPKTGQPKEEAPVQPPVVPGAQPKVPNAPVPSPYTASPGDNPGAIGPNMPGQQYKNALAQTTASGAQVPPTIGGANSTMNGTIQTPNNPPSPLTPILETDKNFDSIFTEYDDFFSPPKQKKSLLQEYKGLEKSLGISELNEELLNSKRIIEGTEDDIRSEVQAVSGFATDSQVIALSNARNKSLIKNYNYLLESRDSAMTQLNTMMNLSIEDRKMAEQEFDRKMNFAFKVQEFQERAKSNAKEGYNNVIKAVGYDGLYKSLQQDPSSIPLVEKTLGLASGGLAQLASQPNLETELKREQILTEKAQRANINSQIRERDATGSSYGTLTGKPQNASQSAANGYADRLNESNITVDQLGSKFSAIGSQLPMFNAMKSADRQAYEASKTNFITAVLRRESGASIAPTEFSNEEQKYFPQPGDKPETVKLKADARNTAINNLYREANVPRPLLPGMVIDKGGKKYKIIGGDMRDPDVEEIK